METGFIKSICRRSGVSELFAVLTERLSASELNSLLLEVYQTQTQQMTPAQLLHSYRENRLVQPSAVDPVAYRTFELHWLKMGEMAGFIPLELSPVSPLGSCSVVGKVHQNKVLSACRGTEVSADITNILALESSRQRQAQNFPITPTQYCGAHRHLRTQQFNQTGFSPHFGIFCLASAGRDTGDFNFETDQIGKQIGLYLQVFNQISPQAELTISLDALHEPSRENRLFEKVKNRLRSLFPQMDFKIRELLQQEHQYYRSVRFGIHWNYRGNSFPMVDGGFTDWTQQLTNNQKERFLSSGIGLELLWKIMNDRL